MAYNLIFIDKLGLHSISFADCKEHVLLLSKQDPVTYGTAG